MDNNSGLVFHQVSMPTSISEYLIVSGFSIKHMASYEEQLYIDFQRTKISSQVDSLIEVIALK